MVLRNTPLRPPLGKTICLFGLRVYRDTRFFNCWQGLAPLPFFLLPMKCVNIDWLEVFCSENTLCTPEYFMSRGYNVKLRPYGTPQYSMMFSIQDEAKRDIIEIRRCPYSLKSQGGIFNENDCHIRLSNRTCYCPDPIGYLRRFLLDHGYRLKLISRIDICLDFATFDNGMSPEFFVSEYMRGAFLKLHQSKLHSYGSDYEVSLAAHGNDTIKTKVWNSLSWGSKKSSVTTKMYNKSLEMRQKKKKHYIINKWEKAGLRPDENDIWRIEFSLSSAIKGYVRIDDGELLPSSLSLYDNEDKLWRAWSGCASRLFVFVDKATATRKSRMKKIRLVDIYDDVCKPVELSTEEDPTRTERMLIRYLNKLRNDNQLSKAEDDAAVTIKQLIQRIRNCKITELSELKLYNETARNGK